MTTLAFQSVSKTYPGGIEALRDLNLEVAAGEMLVLVGPSGCGKSTTLRMTAGLEEITSGSISLDGQIVNEVHPKDRNLAMVFQDYALYPHMTVAQNIAFGLKLRGYPLAEIEARVRNAAERLELVSLLERKPKTLSGGQRQRVALGRAMVRQPKAFLFDEPLSNLDPRLRGEMRSEIKRLQQTLRTTALFVTHDQEEAMTLGDRLAVLNEGRLQQCGEPLEVYEKPVNRFVAGFVGHPAMNFLTGKIMREGDDLIFDEGTTRFVLPQAMSHALNKNPPSYASGTAVLGIRPEHIQLRSVDSYSEGDPILPVRISLVEPLGDRMDVHTTSELQKLLLARISAQRGLKAGETWLLRLDLYRAHLFSADEYGNRIA